MCYHRLVVYKIYTKKQIVELTTDLICCLRFAYLTNILLVQHNIYFYIYNQTNILLIISTKIAVF
jgi:hypothetical protein